MSLNLLLLVPIMLAKPERTLPFLVALAIERVVAWCCYQLIPVTLQPAGSVDPTSFGGIMYRLALEWSDAEEHSEWKGYREPVVRTTR